MSDGTSTVGRRGNERERLWQRWHDYGDDLSTYARRRPRETAVVVLEPRPVDANA